MSLRLVSRHLICWGKDFECPSEWPELGGAVTAGYDIVPPLTEEASALLCGSSWVCWDQAQLSLWAVRAFFNRLNSPWIQNQFLFPKFNQHRNTTLKKDNRISLEVCLLPWFYFQAPLFIDSRCHIVVCSKVCRAGKALRFDFWRRFLCSWLSLQHEDNKLQVTSASVWWTFSIGTCRIGYCGSSKLHHLN